MRLFCPACGQTHSYHPEAVGIVPRLCQCCAFLLEKRTGSNTRHASTYQTQPGLRRYGLTYVLN